MNQFNASLWGDEAFAAVLAQKNLFDIVRIVARDTSPPGYYFLEHFWLLIFGNSEVAIRSLSFLFFLITVFFVYKIGNLLWDRKTGVIAALFTFLNPFLFIYAFEGRMYSMMAAAVTASMYFFLKRSWVGYVIATTIALYSHHFAIFAVFVQGLWFLKEFFWGKRKVAFSMFKAFLSVGILYLPWLYPLYLQTILVGADFWLQTPDLPELWELIRKFLAEGIVHPFTKPAFYLVATILVLRNWGKDSGKSVFLVLWFLTPLVLTFLISQFFQSIFFDRYMLYAIPAGSLILASNRRHISNLLMAAAVLLFAQINTFYFTHPTKQPFGDLANYVKETRQEGDFLINHNARAHHLWESKYYGIPAPLWVPEGELPFYVGTALMVEGDIVRELPDAPRIGVITSGRLEEVSLAGYTQSKSQQFGNLTFAWYSHAK